MKKDGSAHLARFRSHLFSRRASVLVRVPPSWISITSPRFSQCSFVFEVKISGWMHFLQSSRYFFKDGEYWLSKEALIKLITCKVQRVCFLQRWGFLISFMAVVVDFTCILIFLVWFFSHQFYIQWCFYFSLSFETSNHTESVSIKANLYVSLVCL